MRDTDLCLDALAITLAHGDDPRGVLGDEGMNLLSARWHALRKDTPGKTWWNATAMHRSIFRALRMDRAEEGAIYAAAAFRIHRVEAGVRILAALPAPRIFAPHCDNDWLGIETVISWDPLHNVAEVLEGDPATLVGRIPTDGELHIYGDPFAFLRAYAEARAQWFVAWKSIDGEWRQRPPEPDLTPGLFLIGEPQEVRWPINRLPESIITHGLDARALNSAMLRQARIPRAVSAPAPIRRAA